VRARVRDARCAEGHSRVGRLPEAHERLVSAPEERVGLQRRAIELCGALESVRAVRAHGEQKEARCAVRHALRAGGREQRS